MKIMVQLSVDVCRIIYNFLWGYLPEKHTPRYMAETDNIAGVREIIRRGLWSEDDIRVCFMISLHLSEEIARHLYDLVFLGIEDISMAISEAIGQKASINLIQIGLSKLEQKLRLDDEDFEDPYRNFLSWACWVNNVPAVQYFIQELRVDPEEYGTYARSSLVGSSLDVFLHFVSKGFEVDVGCLECAATSGDYETMKVAAREWGYDNEKEIPRSVYVHAASTYKKGALKYLLEQPCKWLREILEIARGTRHIIISQ